MCSQEIALFENVSFALVNISPFSILSKRNVFVLKHQSYLLITKYKNIYITQSSKGFQLLFTVYHQARIVPLRSFKRSDFTYYSNLMFHLTLKVCKFSAPSTKINSRKKGCYFTLVLLLTL